MKTTLTIKKPAHLDVTLKPGTWADPNKMLQKIEEAGYAARKEEIRLTLVGKIAKEGDHYLLVLDDVKPGPQSLLLQSYRGKDTVAVKDNAVTLPKLADFAGRNVEIESYWSLPDKKDKTAPATLAPVRLTLAKPVEPDKHANP